MGDVPQADMRIRLNLTGPAELDGSPVDVPYGWNPEVQMAVALAAARASARLYSRTILLEVTEPDGRVRLVPVEGGGGGGVLYAPEPPPVAVAEEPREPDPLPDKPLQVGPIPPAPADEPLVEQEKQEEQKEQEKQEEEDEAPPRPAYRPVHAPGSQLVDHAAAVSRADEAARAAITVEETWDPEDDEDYDWDGETRRKPPYGRRRLMLAAGVLIIALVLAGVVSTLMNKEDRATPAHSTTTTPSASVAAPATVRVPVTVPPGWNTENAWSLPIAAPQPQTPTVAGDEQNLAVLSPGREVLIIDPATGKQRRSAPLPEGLPGGLRLTQVDGKPCAVVQVGSNLLIVPADPAAPPVTVPVPAGGRVTTGGDSPLVSLRDGAAAVVLGQGTAPVAVPPGATAMAADGNAAISAAPAGPWWVSRPDSAPQQATPDAPRPGAQIMKIAGAGHGRVAVVWNGADDGHLTAAVHDAATGRRLITTDVAVNDFGTPTWVWGSGGHVAALGPIVFDLDQNTGRVHPGFVPVVAWGRTVWGQYDGGAATVEAGSTTPPVRLPAGAPLPWGAPGGRLLLTGSTPEGANLLYGLNPTKK